MLLLNVKRPDNILLLFHIAALCSIDLKFILPCLVVLNDTHSYMCIEYLVM